MSGFLGLTGGTGALGLLSEVGIAADVIRGPLTLQLGEVTFEPLFLEVPEHFGSLGGDQIIAQHDFPGGTRTQQTYGAFPAEIEWRGLLTGPLALDRIAEIDRIRVAAEPVILSYGPKQWDGRVVTFTPRVRHQWLIEYEIRFLPLVDLTAPDPSLPLSTPEAQLFEQIYSLESLVSNVPFLLPVGLSDPVVADLVSTVQAALSSSNGIVDNISAADQQGIAAAVLAVQTAGQSILSSATASSADAYMAVAAMNAATLVGQIVAAPNTPTVTVQVVNPILPALAAQYLGDASLWQDIAYVNSINPPDPMPIGSFSLLIPPANTTPIPA